MRTWCRNQDGRVVSQLCGWNVASSLPFLPVPTPRLDTPNVHSCQLVVPNLLPLACSTFVSPLKTKPRPCIHSCKHGP